MFRLYPTAVWLRPQSLLALTRWFCNEPLPPPSLPLPRSQNKNKSPAGLVGESPLRGKGYISRWSNKKMFWFILKERRIFLNQHHTPSIGATRYRLVRQLSVRFEYLMFLKLKKYVSKLNKYVFHSREWCTRNERRRHVTSFWEYFWLWLNWSHLSHGKDMAGATP